MECTAHSAKVTSTCPPLSDTYGHTAITAGTPSNRTRSSPNNPKAKGLSPTYEPVPNICGRSSLNCPNELVQPKQAHQRLRCRSALRQGPTHASRILQQQNGDELNGCDRHILREQSASARRAGGRWRLTICVSHLETPNEASWDG